MITAWHSAFTTIIPRECTIELLLTGCITVWYGNCSAQSRISLQRLVEAARHITGNRLPVTEDIFHQQCLRMARSIIKDHSHPSCRLFSLLPSGRRYRNMAARTPTTRLKDSFYHTSGFSNYISKFSTFFNQECYIPNVQYCCLHLSLLLLYINRHFHTY